MENAGNKHLSGTRKLFRYYRSLGDIAIERVDHKRILWQDNDQSKGIAVITKRIAGNSLYRWTGLLNSDGEKE